MKLIIMLIVIAFTTFLNGFTISTLWGWFIIPIFALPTLTTLQAAGIGLLISYATATKPPTDKDYDFHTHMAEVIAFYIVLSMISLGIGWVIK